MQVVLAVGDGNLDVGLVEGGGDGAGLGVDFADENGGFAGCPGEFFQSADFGCHGCGEEESLAFRWGREDGEAFFHVRQHASRHPTCQQPIRFVEHHHADSSQSANRVLSRRAYVIC